MGGQVGVYAMQYEGEWSHHTRQVSYKLVRNTGSPAARVKVGAFLSSAIHLLLQDTKRSGRGGQSPHVAGPIQAKAIVSHGLTPEGQGNYLIVAEAITRTMNYMVALIR